jgi:rare lipoprotein A
MAVESARPNGVLAARNAALVVLLAGAATACASTGTSLSLATPPRQGQVAQAQPPSSRAPSGRLRGTDKPYQVSGQWYFPQADPNYDEVGTASWYGYPFQNRHTADGEVYDQELITAAHKTLPLPCIVEVTNLQNGRSIRVRVNDRGPFVGGRLIDLSKAAAEQLGFDRRGTTRVRVRFITMATPLTAPGLMMASNAPRSPSAPPPPYAPQPRAYEGAFDDIEAAPPPPAIQTSYATPATAPPSNPSPYSSASSQRDDPMAEDEAGPPETAPSPATAPITATTLPPPEQAVRTPVAERVAVAGGGGYSVQAGAFATQSSADRAAARLASAGGAQIVPLQRNGATLYRVVVGSFRDPAEASETRARVIAMGFSDARVVGAD